MSLRIKLLLLLVLVPTFVLAAYMALFVGLFTKDKIAYVFDTNALVARTLASQLKTEVDTLFTAVRPILEKYSVKYNSVAGSGMAVFNANKKISHIAVYEIDSVAGNKKLFQIEKAPITLDEIFVNDIIKSAEAHQVAIRTSPNKDKKGQAIMAVYQNRNPKKIAFLIAIESADLEQAFEKSGAQKSFVYEKSGKLLVGPAKENMSEFNNNFQTAGLYTALNESLIPEITREYQLDQDKSYLASFAKSGLAGLYVITIVEKATALSSILEFRNKAILFFIALIAAALIVSFVSSAKLTNTLRLLSQAAKKVSTGDFNVRVDTKSKDEVGTLAESFNMMAAEMTNIVETKAKNARMEGELATAKLVQETLFPPPLFETGPVKIAGHFQPASECGGDWWYYCDSGDRVLIWLGDVTGHGAAAALMTSAARSAVTIIERMPEVSPAAALSMLNRAIFETSKGKLQMTFFLGSLNKKTGELTYACASHEAPYLWHKSDSVTKGDLIALNEVTSARLGQAIDSKYEETKTQLKSGDTIFMYTDGVVDLKNPEQKSLGERQFIKLLTQCASQNKDPNDLIQNLHGELEKFRIGTELIDDVTLVGFKYEPTV